eukprot:1210095-Rhodomonas_salina.1
MAAGLGFAARAGAGAIAAPHTAGHTRAACLSLLEDVVDGLVTDTERATAVQARAVASVAGRQRLAPPKLHKGLPPVG